MAELDDSDAWNMPAEAYLHLCSRCLGELKPGYGLAGGGIGAYWYCENCGVITDKVQDKD